MVGNGGASLRPISGSKPSWTVARNDVDHGYLDVNVEDGTLTAQMLTPSGKVLDSFSLTKDLPPPSSPPVGEQPGPTQPSTGTPRPDSITGDPGLPTGPDPLPGDPGPSSAGCSASPMAALLPAGALLLAGALRRRRRQR